MNAGDILARKQLQRLLSAHESSPDRSRRAATAVTPPRDLSVDAHYAWRHRLLQAETIGAIAIKRGRGNQREALTRIYVADPLLLATQVLGVKPASERAEEAIDAAIGACAGRSEMIAVVDEAADFWARGRAWEGIPPDALLVQQDFSCAELLLTGALSGLDRRTAAMQAAGTSKYLDQRGGPVAAILRRALDLPDDLSKENVFEQIGIVRFGHPICLRAPAEAQGINCGGAPWIGLCPDSVPSVRPIGVPPYILFVENWASFNRHAREINDGAAVLYTGGFPSTDVAAMARTLAALWPSVPIAHWGDIDAGGLLIAEGMEAAIGRHLCPHLMTRDLPSSRWQPSSPLKRVTRLSVRNDAWGCLAAFLSGPEARTLEQEAIDPQPFNGEG